MNNTSNLQYFNTEILQSLQLNSTSKGNQSKWYDLKEKLFIKKQFEYQDKFWRDDLVEIIASEIAKQMPIEWSNITVVEQKPCILQENGKEYLRHSFVCRITCSRKLLCKSGAIIR